MPIGDNTHLTSPAKQGMLSKSFLADWPSLLLAVVSSLLFAVVFIASMIASIENSQSERGQYLIAEVDNIADEARSTLVILNERGMQACTTDNLLFMRQTLFLASYIKDIGFYVGDKLVCTAGIGKLASPYDEGPPDYVTEDRFRVHVSQPLLMFDKAYHAFIVGHRRYSVVLDLGSLSRMDFSPFDWELIHRYGDVYTHISGRDDLYQRALAEKSRNFYQLNSLFMSCSEKHPFYCAAVSIDAPAFLKHYTVPIFWGLVISLCLGTLIFSLHQKYLKHQLSIAPRIRKGLKKGCFYWQVQPIVAMNDLNIKGCEVLARFEDKHGPVYPDQFIPVLRDLKLSWPFTRMMLEKMLTTMEEYKQLPGYFKVGFNIFPRDLLSPEVIEQLINLPSVKNTRFKIMLEIVEDESLDSSAVHGNIRRLRDNGILIAIDDFGTGYSNLNQLKNIDCQTLKIDRSFVMDMEAKSVRSSLIPHVVEIASELGMDVVAEGVENLYQQQQLASLGVSHGQGWFFGRPMAVDRLASLVPSE